MAAPAIENRLQLIHHYGVGAEQISAQPLRRDHHLHRAGPAPPAHPKKGRNRPGQRRRSRRVGPLLARPISAKTHHMRVDYSMFEGDQVTGNARTVLSRGEVIVDGNQNRQARPRQLPAAHRAWWRSLRPPGSCVTTSRSIDQDLPTVPPGETHPGTYNFAALWDLDVGARPPTCSPAASSLVMKLAAGDPHHPARESHRADPDGAQRSRRTLKYGIPFPVLVRTSFGVRGANIPAVLRALVACGLVRYTGVDRRPGDGPDAQRARAPAADFAGGVWICFFAFWGLNMRELVVARHRHHQVSSKASARRSSSASGYCCSFGSRARPRASARCSRLPATTPPPSSSGSSSPPSPAWWDSGPLRRAQHPDFHHHTPNRRRRNLGPSPWTADHDDLLTLSSCCGDFSCRWFWSGTPHPGSGGAAQKIDQPRCSSIAIIALLLATLTADVAANVVSPSTIREP